MRLHDTISQKGVIVITVRDYDGCECELIMNPVEKGDKKAKYQLWF
jgi:hypothetical protein